MEFNEKIDEFVKNLLNIKPDAKILENALHGTTIVAVKYKGGVVMAGDMRMCMGQMEISSETFEKVFRVDGKTLIAIAGTASIALQAIEFLKTEIEYYEKIEESELSFEAKANLLSKILNKLAPLGAQGIVFLPILASKDKIYAFDGLGMSFERNCYACGSGESFVIAGMEKAWKENLTKEEAVKIVVDALDMAAAKNLQTGLNKAIYIVENEIKKLTEAEIKQARGGDKDGK